MPYGQFILGLFAASLILAAGCTDSDPKGKAGSEKTAKEQDSSDDAAPTELGIGSPAPAISIASWVKGEPLEEFQPGTVYVVEFWATWCDPCRISMPHLSKLQEKYNDQVRIIGVTDETADVVQSFLDQKHVSGETWDEVITYSIALDEDRQTIEAYMLAARQSGIPTAFIVGKDGVVEWIGPPMALDDPLQRIVEDRYDRAAAIAKYEIQQKMNSKMMAIQQAAIAENWNEALEIVNGLIADLPDETQPLLVKMQILKEAERHEEASKVVAQIIEKEWKNFHLLNGLAWSLADDEPARDLDLALKAAKQAAKLTDHQDGDVLDTLGRVYYETGDLDEAIRWQKQAVAADPDTSRIAEALKRYEKEKADNAGTDAETDGKTEKESSEPDATP